MNLFIQAIIDVEKNQLNTWYPTAVGQGNYTKRPRVWLIAGADGMRAYVWENGVKAVKIIETNVFSLEGNYLN